MGLDLNQVVIFNVLKRRTEKWDKIIYYSHGLYKRGCHAYIWHSAFDYFSEDHADFLNAILLTKEFNKNKLVSLRDSLKKTKDIYAVLKENMTGINFFLNCGEASENELLTNWFPTSEKDIKIHIKPGIGLPKQIHPDYLFPDDPTMYTDTQNAVYKIFKSCGMEEG